MYSDGMNTWDDVFSAFNTTAEIAAGLKVPYQTAAAWRRRKSIPSRYWSTLIDRAREKRIPGLTLDALARINTSSARA
jgi:hypothetical protein